MKKIILLSAMAFVTSTFATNLTEVEKESKVIAVVKKAEKQVDVASCTIKIRKKNADGTYSETEVTLNESCDKLVAAAVKALK